MTAQESGTPGRFAQGTTSGALVRIAGVLALLLGVAVVVGALQAAGWTVAWGFYGPLLGLGLVWCVLLWRGRRETDVGPRVLQEVDALLAAVEQERVTPVEERRSGVGNDLLFHVRDLAELARKDVSFGFYDRAGETALHLEEQVRAAGGLAAGSPLADRVAALAATARTRQERRGARRRRRT